MPNHHGKLHGWATRPNVKNVLPKWVFVTLRALRPFYGRRGGPSKSTLQRLVAKFESTGSINNLPTPVRAKTARSAENIAAVRDSVQENPRQSNHRREAITVTGERYRRMITDFFRAKLDDLHLDDMWFQQDSATSHTADATMDLLHERFEGMVISRRGDVNWPPRSCDLSPLDFFCGIFWNRKCTAIIPQQFKSLKTTLSSRYRPFTTVYWITRLRISVKKCEHAEAVVINGTYL